MVEATAPAASPEHSCSQPACGPSKKHLQQTNTNLGDGDNADADDVIDPRKRRVGHQDHTRSLHLMQLRSG
jgi:hypothetical protein